MPSLTEALQAQCRTYMGTAGTFNEDLYGALAYLFQESGAQLSGLIAKAGGMPNLLYNGLWNAVVLPRAAQALARKNNASLWYAGSAADLSGFVFQDSTGTTPATGTDPIGLLLDRQYGAGNLGAELVVNGNFATDTAWTKGTGWSISGGSANITSSAGFSNLSQNLGLVAGKTYEVTFTLTISAGTILVYAGLGGANRTVTSSGTYTSRLGAAVDAFVYIQAATGTTASVDSIYVREVLGFPALQATAANKPTLELQANGYYGMRFDGGNDSIAPSGPVVGGAGSTYTLISAGYNTDATNVLQGMAGRFGGAAGGAYLLKDAATNLICAGAGDKTQPLFTATVTWASPRVATLVRGSTNARLYVGGALEDTETPADSGTGSPPLIGGLNNVTIPGQFWTGVVALVCASATAIPDADRIAIERFAALLSGATYA